MRLLFLGDLVGRAGRNIVIERLPGLIAEWNLDFVIVNGENSAHGFGISEEIFNDVIGAGADVITLGNHAFDQKDTQVWIERQSRLLRPVNFPPGTPGRGAYVYEGRRGHRVLVMNVMGRIYMDALDDPFRAVDKEIEACPLGQMVDAIVIDMHAEATSEKQAMGHFVDGRATLVVGTHTHVPTADHRVLPGGTAYLSDAGMCGDYDSVLGMEKDEPVSRFLRKIAAGRFQPAQGPATLCGVAVETDGPNGLATGIWPVRLGASLSEAVPPWGTK